MINRVLVILIASVTITLVCIALAPLAPVPEEVAFTFPLAVGTKWTYRSNTHDRVEVIDKVTPTDDNNGVLVWISRETEGKLAPSERLLVANHGIYRDMMDGSEIAPPDCQLRLPIKVGETWKTVSVFRGREVIASNTISKTEEVETLAGRYQAIRVDSDFSHSVSLFSPFGSSGSASYWYASGVGLIKYKSGQLEYLLKSFTSGTGETPVPPGK